MSIKVLLLDDEPDNLLLLRTSITRSSYGDEVQCISFRSGEDALVWCKQNSVDLCIVDYNMPGMDGLEFVQAVREIESYKYVPIAVFSAHIEEAFHVRIRRGGADDLIEKTTDLVELRKRIHAYIELHKRYAKYYTHLENLSAGNCIPGQLPEEELQKAIREMGLAFMKSQDQDEHFLRVSRLAEAIACNLGVGDGYCERIYYATPYHDIGKHLLPNKIWDEVFGRKKADSGYLPLHTIMGSKLLSASNLKDSKLAAEIAMSHHERFDGRGYPYALAGEDIPLSARIVAVADSLDSLLSTNSEKYTEFSLSEALIVLKKQSGKELDPKCVEALNKDTNKIADIYQASLPHTSVVAHA